MRRRLRDVSTRLSGALGAPRAEAAAATDVTAAPDTPPEPTEPQEPPAVPTTDVTDRPEAAAPALDPGVDEPCLAAVELARAAAGEVAGDAVGEHLGAAVDEQQVVTHLFATRDRGYVGWHWAVTVTRADGADEVTVDEVVLLPGDGALLAPPWVPYADRVRPEDLSPGDLLPPAPDDPRLVPAYADPDAGLDDVAFELGLGRVRVLSLDGRADAAERWYDGDRGPRAPLARAAPARCADCGFLVRLGGSLRQLFGVCANGNAPDDGRVVSLDHGCGAHSEVLPAPVTPAELTVAHDELELVDLQPVPGAVTDAAGHPPGTVGDADPAEPLGHS